LKTVASAAISGAANLIHSYGVDPESVAKEAGIASAALSDPDLVIDGEAVLAFFYLASKACNERFFGIELARRQGLEILGAVWIVARHAATIGEALENITDAMQIYSNAFIIRPVREADGIAFCYDTVMGDQPSEVQAVEHGFTLLCQEIRAHAGAAWMPRYSQFRSAAPTTLSQHHKEFGHSISFNQDRNALLVHYDVLALPLQSANKRFAVVKRELQLRQRMYHESFVNRVEMVVRNLLSSEVCEAATVADELNLSVRTLQQRLAKHDTHYQAILDKVRISLACKYLGESDLSVAELAELLQFSETSAFSRFFKKRKGISPRAFRSHLNSDI